MSTFPSSAHLELLIRGERALDRVRPLITKLENCGGDCSQFRAGDADLSQFFAAARREFFGDQIVPPSGSGVPTQGE